MKRFEACGISLLVPVGWEVRITNPTGRGDGERPFLHAANFPLPSRRAPFGGGVVHAMGPTDVFVALIEYEPKSAATALFASHRVPVRLQRGDFSPSSLQRAIRGQTGLQQFFHVSGRAFCLYVVVGGHPGFRSGLNDANDLLWSVRVNATAGVL